MANLRDLKTRIQSVKSTQKITSAMKMVATSHLKRAQDKLHNAAPYLQGLTTAMHATLKQAPEMDIPLLLKGNKAQSKDLILFITGDRGLCSNYNALVLQQTHTLLKGSNDYHLSAIGKKGKDHFTRYEKLHREFRINFHQPYREAQFIANYIHILMQTKEIGRCKIVYTHFQSALNSNVVVYDLIPFSGTLITENNDTKVRPLFDVEPTLPKLLDTMALQHLTAEIFYCLLSSKASEEGARMVAMDNASRNASDMIQNLQLLYNRTRQAHITRELIEIIAGAEAV